MNVYKKMTILLVFFLIKKGHPKYDGPFVSEEWTYLTVFLFKPREGSFICGAEWWVHA